jgi:hypothetical protein
MILLFPLHRFEGGFEPLVELCQVAGMGQHRFDHGFEEDPFGERGPTGAANRLHEVCVVGIAGEFGDGLFHFAEFPLESLNLIGGGFGLCFCQCVHLGMVVTRGLRSYQGMRNLFWCCELGYI